MSAYIPPVSNGCNFNFTVRGYIPPVSNAANFNFGFGGIFGPDTEKRRKFLIGVQ